MTQDQLELVRSLVADILRRDGPQPGARLKSQLCAAYMSRTGQPFHERLLGFPKFSRLLEAQLDLVVVERPVAGPGDIIVRLRESIATAPRIGPPPGTDVVQRDISSRAARPLPFGTSSGSSQATSTPPTGRISKALWSAFISPDPNRERYLHKPTGEVVTFSKVSTKTVDALLRQRFEMVRGDCVAIDFIPFDVQVGWMEEFARSFLTDEKQERVLADVRRLNQWTAHTGFLNLVGPELAARWRQLRSERVISRIREWLMKQGLPESLMISATAPPEKSTRKQTPHGPYSRTVDITATLSTQVEGLSRPSMRELLHALIDTLPDEQLDRVLVPGSALARLSSILRSVRG